MHSKCLCYALVFIFFLPGDQEVGNKVEMGEVDAGKFLSLQVNKELSHSFL